MVLHFYWSGGILHRVDGWAAARLCRRHICGTAGWIFSIQSSMELSRPEVVLRHDHLPFAPYGLAAIKLSNQVPLGSRLAEHISLKLLDGFALFQVL